MSKGRLHQKVASLNGKLAYIRDHTYLDDTYHRLSNWVTYSFVGEKGIVKHETMGDYDKGQFIIVQRKIDVIVHNSMFHKTFKGTEMAKKKKLPVMTPISPIPGPSQTALNEELWGPEANHSYVIAHNLGVIALRLGKIAEMLNDRL